MIPGPWKLQLLLPAWALVAARMGGLVMATPLFSSESVPPFVRAMLILAMSVMMLPAALPQVPAGLTWGHVAGGMAGELVIGVLLGLAASVVFLAAQLAGQFVAQQAGLGLGEVFNPLLEADTTAVQQIWFYTGLIVFFGAGGANALVRVLLESFERVPPLMFLKSADGETGSMMAEFCADTLGLTFHLAVRLAAPAMVALLLSTMAMGLLVKTMPQFNVLTVGFAVKVGLALLLVAMTLSGGSGPMTDAMFDALESVREVLRS
ncbi:MAG: flagellar biosynthetic protein FliR [Phycisphaerae bacterium]|nr:flagellar biosynthetic protein FliR [Phycisphaerae bacterium]NUQ45739.1 flagellar biosynthetic protein FliR [Phycisphaerae bacterium]